MAYNSDFSKMISGGYRLVSVNIVYYLPDHQSLVNEFFWQTLDLTPKYPRVHKFLDFWRKEIDAIIKDIQVCDAAHLETTKWRNGVYFPINGRFDA